MTDAKKLTIIMEPNGLEQTINKRYRNMKFNVTFNSEECKGCELCTVWCKKKLITFDTSFLNKQGIHPATIENMEECIGCCNCALMCPDAIITIEKIEDEQKGKE